MFDAAQRAMAEVLVDYENTIAGADGSRWAARACGRQGPGNLWEGWIEFVPLDGGSPLRGRRETTQPSRDDLVYWATGITPLAGTSRASCWRSAQSSHGCQAAAWRAASEAGPTAR